MYSYFSISVFFLRNHHFAVTASSLDLLISSRQPSSKELLVGAVACSVMENVTFRHSRNPIAQNAQGESTLNEVLQLLQSVERSLAQIESSLNLCITAVETS